MGRKLCSEAQLFRGLEKLYGSLDSDELAERLEMLGLPEDKYDAAAVTVAYTLPVAAADEASIIAPSSSRRITSSSFNSILSCQVADSTVCCIASPERPYVCPRI